MIKTTGKHQRTLNQKTIDSISVSVVYEDSYDKDIKTITIAELLEKFRASKSWRIYKEHHIPFVTCLKAFLGNHFEGLVEPTARITKIDGLTTTQLKRIEVLCMKR